MTYANYPIEPGNWNQGGVTLTRNGVNFCVFSRHAERIELLLFEHDESLEPFQVIELDPITHRTFFFWHVLVVDLPMGIYYNWRAYGQGDTRATGRRFDGEKALLDPGPRP